VNYLKSAKVCSSAFASFEYLTHPSELLHIGLEFSFVPENLKN
jgi:hypothetical protein